MTQNPQPQPDEDDLIIQFGDDIQILDDDSAGKLPSGTTSRDQTILEINRLGTSAHSSHRRPPIFPIPLDSFQPEAGEGATLATNPILAKHLTYLQETVSRPADGIEDANRLFAMVTNDEYLDHLNTMIDTNVGVLKRAEHLPEAEKEIALMNMSADDVQLQALLATANLNDVHVDKVTNPKQYTIGIDNVNSNMFPQRDEDIERLIGTLKLIGVKLEKKEPGDNVEITISKQELVEAVDVLAAMSFEERKTHLKTVAAPALDIALAREQLAIIKNSVQLADERLGVAEGVPQPSVASVAVAQKSLVDRVEEHLL